MQNKNMEEIVKYCIEHGFIYPGSEIYGGLANTWDYGPLGVRLKNNIMNQWRYYFVQKLDNSYELDSGIFMHPDVWKASGHLDGFSDPLIDCKECKSRWRVDNLIDDFDPTVVADTLSEEEMQKYIKDNKVSCPKCKNHNFTDIRQFNLMFSTKRGVTEDKSTTIYLRPENAQGQYVNFLNVMRTTREKIPFSIAQIGKAFRNEITPGNFIFRTIEFEQMELQTFCKKGEDEKLYDFYKEYGKMFFNQLGLPSDKLRYHDHDKLAHYAKDACDIEYLFPFGWGEINGTHNRTDFDLKNHQEFTNKKMEVIDEETKERYIPYIVESTYGVGRILLAVICEALVTETTGDKERTILKLKPSIAPIKVSVLPLQKNKHSEKAMEVYESLRDEFMTTYDHSGSIGRRYTRSDLIGIPFAICIDDDSLDKDTVTVRDRDTMEQDLVPIKDLETYLHNKIKNS